MSDFFRGVVPVLRGPNILEVTMLNKKQLKNQIWTTRISRINAEKRLLGKESFIQGINIYYSCFIILVSLFSLIYKSEKLSFVAVLMNISLLMAILYLNGKKYLENSREYRKNYTELQKLEFKLDIMDNNDDIEEIVNNYCELMDSSSNHISYDYYKAIHDSTDESYAEKRKEVKCKYYFNRTYRVLLKVALVALPILIFVLVWVI